MSTLRSSSRFQTTAGALAVVSATALVAVWSIFIHPWTSSNDTPAPSPPTLPPATPQLVLPLVSKDEFYRRELVPLLEKAKASNRASADKALDRLHQEFDRFRTGIPGFVNDVSSWRTRFGILRRLSRDKWTNFWKAAADADSEEVKNYMLGKFEYHILAQDELQKAVGSSLSEFKDDVAATRNRLLAELKVALTTSDMNLDFARPDFAAFQREFDQFIAKRVESNATDSLANATVNLLANSLAGFAAEQLVAQLIVRLAAAQAVAAGAEAAAAGGSSTAGSATLGGAAGWLGGPIGAVIGVGAGLAVGAVVDWWVTEKFKANLTEQLTTYLDNLERDMINGVTATDEQPARIGLREALHSAADKFYAIQSQAALNAL
jgi:hypothetical protein